PRNANKAELSFPDRCGKNLGMFKTRILFNAIIPLVALASASCLRAAEHASVGYQDTPLIPGTQWHVHDGERPQPRVVKPGATFSHMAPAPSDAVVLFDGKDLSKFKSDKGD